MSAIASWLRRHWLEAVWVAFAGANVAVIVLLSQWETIPFHFVWVSLTLLYGMRVWRVRVTMEVLLVVMAATGAALLWSVSRTPHSRPDELAEVPLMAAVFVAMVWHARRRQAAVEEARRMADNEHRMLERQREFVRDASHELRTPITVARGHTELIRAAAPGTQVARDADIVLDELARLARLSERLLILAAAEHPGFVRLEPVDVGRLVSATGERWRAAADRRWSVDAVQGGWLEADPDRLAAALDALIENAVKFTREGDRISVRVRPDGEDAVIEIVDTGEGVPLDQQARIFERFSRADGSRDRAKGGMGLGLAIVKAIVEAHGGDVAVTSAPGAGSTFAIRLPGFSPSVATQAGAPAPVRA
jgi:signal transduction histidine kinase